MFWLECQSSNTVAFYAVWRNLYQNRHFRGDLNNEIYLKLCHKNWLTRAAGQTGDQMFPTLWFFVSPVFIVNGPLLFFTHTSPEHAHNFEKMTKFSIFSKFKYLVKLVENAPILSNFTRQWLLNSILWKFAFLKESYETKNRF